MGEEQCERQEDLVAVVPGLILARWFRASTRAAFVSGMCVAPEKG